MRKRKNSAWVMAMVFFLGWPALARAEQVDYAASQESSQALKLPLGARGVSLGEAMSASSRGVESLEWNPAGLSEGKIHQLLADYVNLPGGIQAGTLAYAWNSPWIALGASVSYIDFGVIERLDLDPYGYPVRTRAGFQPRGVLATLGVGRKISPDFQVGGDVKFYREDLVDELTNRVSGDLGVQVRTGFPGLRIGTMVKNIGRELKGFSPPWSAQAGLAYQSELGLAARDHWTGCLDAVFSGTQALQAGAGLEYELDEMFCFRLGYRSNALLASSDAISGFSAGLGFRWSEYEFQYAFSPDSVMGASHRLTLEAGFGAGTETKKKTNDQGDGQYLFKYLNRR